MPDRPLFATNHKKHRPALTFRNIYSIAETFFMNISSHYELHVSNFLIGTFPNSKPLRG